MSTIIRTRSPFFIRTPQVTGSTNIANLSYFQINITVFGGLSSSTEICDDLYATYSLQKKPLGAEVSVSFDISEIVNDHLEQIFTGTYSDSLRERRKLKPSKPCHSWSSALSRRPGGLPVSFYHMFTYAFCTNLCP